MLRYAYQALRIVTHPTVEPVSVDEAKTHCHVTHTEEDSYIEALIPVARRHAENEVTRRAFITQTWDMKLDAFPSCGTILVPRPPLQSVTSITYKLEDGTTSTYAASNYAVDADSEPGRIILQPLSAWPSDALYPGASVTIRFVAGYGATAASVPQPYRHGIALLVAHLFENREAVAENAPQMGPLPLGVDSFLAFDRIFTS